jgi:endonuclease III
LTARYGRQPEPLRDPLELILWENLGYLASDDRREQAFLALREQVGLDPQSILQAPLVRLISICRIGGIHPELRAERLREIASLALEKFGGDLSRALSKRDLKLFPTIGDPGAEKILLFGGVQAALALESNGLRVLVRLGHGREHKSYSATYRGVQEALKSQAGNDCTRLTIAFQLLRRHGQELCTRTRPRCHECPLSSECRFHREGG